MPLASLNPTPTLATRHGITWGLDAPTEDSSVLVTGTPSGHYIDVRFALTGAPTEGPFWAFAGQSTYKPLPSDGCSSGWGQVVRGEWAHPIDSMGNFEGKDYADVMTFPNGDQIETGMLEHPETGKPSQFKEYWTKPEDADAYYPIARAVYQQDGKDRGVMIRVGKWIQAIRQVSDTQVEVGRWREQAGSWVEEGLSAQSGQKSFPIEWFVASGKQGESVAMDEQNWTVVEIANN
jgi:hypothetical protein